MGSVFLQRPFGERASILVAIFPRQIVLLLTESGFWEKFIVQVSYFLSKQRFIRR
jgi:hypothetical protein